MVKLFNNPRIDMGKYQCSTHGVEYNYQCPLCLSEEESADRQNIIDGLSDLNNNIIYKQANPGDYECPGCRFITLKWCAHRCPKCHFDISTKYWEEVFAEEKKAKERAKVLRQEEAERAETRKKEMDTTIREAAHKEREANTAITIMTSIIAVIIVFIAISLSRACERAWNQGQNINESPFLSPISPNPIFLIDSEQSIKRIIPS